MNFKHILNSNGEIIALLDRIDPAFRFEFISNGNLIPFGNQKEQRSYELHFPSGKKVVLNKSFNKKPFEKNPFYKPRGFKASHQKVPVLSREKYQA